MYTFLLSIPLEIKLGGGHRVFISSVVIWILSVSIVVVPIYTATSSYKFLVVPYPCQHLVFFHLFYFRHPGGVHQ